MFKFLEWLFSLFRDSTITDKEIELEEIKLIHPVYKDDLYYRAYGTKRNGELYSGKYYHLGHDYNVEEGTTVRAISVGTVVYVGQVNGFGSMFPDTKGGCVIIQHTINKVDYFAVYGHLDNIQVITGDYVVETDYIGDVNGFTSNGEKLPHLHFGLFKEGKVPYTSLGYDTSLRNSISPKEFIDNNNGKWFS